MANATTRPYLMNVKTQWRILSGAAVVAAAAVLPGGLIVLLVVHVVRRWRRKVQARALSGVRQEGNGLAQVGDDLGTVVPRRTTARLFPAHN
jgi:hypothetical protein